MDEQLRITLHFSAFCALPLLWCRGYDSLAIFSVYSRCFAVGEAKLAERMNLFLRSVGSTDKSQYLGPSGMQLALFLCISVANSITLIALTILLLRTLWGLGANITTIEAWEISRHERLVRRAKVLGGYLDGPDGIKIKIDKQEFPYDIGIWNNIKQGMGGSSNPLHWFWPLASTPSRENGLTFETNGFEDETKSWPPPDPDRIPRQQKSTETPFTYEQELSDHERITAFRQRQEADFRRREGLVTVERRVPFSERYERTADGYIEKDNDDSASEESQADDLSGEEGWRSPDGDRLRDFGVDEDIEFYDG
ncbi:MAG: hypothetical protein Q9227_004254 [Pyrenula ochraceoflavens]